MFYLMFFRLLFGFTSWFSHFVNKCFWQGASILQNFFIQFTVSLMTGTIDYVMGLELSNNCNWKLFVWICNIFFFVLRSWYHFFMKTGPFCFDKKYNLFCLVHAFLIFLKFFKQCFFKNKILDIECDNKVFFCFGLFFSCLVILLMLGVINFPMQHFFICSQSNFVAILLEPRWHS